ncbi:MULTISPECIES: DUF3307 domain-containing protein [Halomonadaceae]|uniref:DUF3307 domain-containing protein n=1 Tax=Halomonadaceae TaxID=28256 RepID=UPI001598A2FB|nr:MULTISPECIES: DUF3307 domain-containing protein [Halomonas]QJQ94687.1 DUF3307 domain-containing protein [Halomonas sp. PA5]
MNSLEHSLLLGLVLVHLIGDFLLQPSHWVAERYRLKTRSPCLYWHALLHGALATLVLLIAARSEALPGSMAGALAGGLAVTLSHAAIDLVKSHLEPRRLLWFLADQLLHFSVIVAIWLVWIDSWQPLALFTSWLARPQTLGLIAAYLLVSRPMSVAIALIMQRWSRELEETGTLADAGARIGILERFLVLTLALLEQMTAVGFLLAAKSVLRFGDLRESQDRKLTEYVLLGTLLSVSSTLILGLIIRTWLLGN